MTRGPASSWRTSACSSERRRTDPPGSRAPHDSRAGHPTGGEISSSAPDVRSPHADRTMTAASRDTLRSSWDRLVAPFGPAPAVFGRLADAYSESHRHYHDLDHLADLLRHVPDLR